MGFSIKQIHLLLKRNITTTMVSLLNLLIATTLVFGLPNEDAGHLTMGAEERLLQSVSANVRRKLTGGLYCQIEQCGYNNNGGAYSGDKMIDYDCSLDQTCEKNNRKCVGIPASCGNIDAVCVRQKNLDQYAANCP